MSLPARIKRSDWPRVVGAFREFFDALGAVVTETEDEVAFEAGYTGLAIDRNGTSRSFMPLHDLSAAWEAIEFDYSSREVTLFGDGATYMYRVPPQLVG